MAHACFVTSPFLPTSLKPSSLSPFNKSCVLKSANNVYTRISIRCTISSTQQELGSAGVAPNVSQNGQKGDTKPIPINIRPDELQRSHFGEDFIFGVGTSAIQIEGNGAEGGRGPSTGDYTIHADKGGKGVDSYKKFKEDVALLKKMGIPYYRFSISWPRILPDGNLKNINKEGIKYYNDLLDELEKNNVKPFVTLFHFDLPEALQKQYNGFMDRRIIKDFTDYCNLCFKEFGDRVKHWITINEAATFILFTDMCLTPEQRKDPRNQFIANHNILLCHAEAVKLYRKNYRETQQGELGMAIVSKWYEPSSPTSDLDNEAANLSFDFLMGWFMDPLKCGDYPDSMKKWAQGLPEFTPEESEAIKDSCDFFGINYYTGAYTTVVPSGQMLIKDGVTDLRYLIVEKDERDGIHIGQQADGVYKICIYPDGLGKLLLRVKEKYGDQKMYITENGCSSYPKIRMSKSDAEARGKAIEIENELKDKQRLEYLQLHLYEVLQAKSKGANVQGYIFWSLLDNCEFGNYDVRFGLAFVDYHDDYKRHLKQSGEWYASFLANKPIRNSNNPQAQSEATNGPN